MGSNRVDVSTRSKTPRLCQMLMKVIQGSHESPMDDSRRRSTHLGMMKDRDLGKILGDDQNSTLSADAPQRTEKDTVGTECFFNESPSQVVNVRHLNRRVSEQGLSNRNMT